jgi:hypothetical protein
MRESRGVRHQRIATVARRGGIADERLEQSFRLLEAIGRMRLAARALREFEPGAMVIRRRAASTSFYPAK